MKNIDLIKSFHAGATKGRTEKLKIVDNQLIHYDWAVLAERIEDGLYIIYDGWTGYSATTSKIMYYIRANAPLYTTISERKKEVHQ